MCGYIGEIDQFWGVVVCDDVCGLGVCSFIDDGVGVSGGAGSVHRSRCEVEALEWVGVGCVGEEVGVGGSAACAHNPCEVAALRM